MKRSCMLLVCTLASLVLIAQTKSYKGLMIIPKDTPIIPISGTAAYEPGKTECEAEYSYYEQNGQRVKHGSFTYKYIGYTGGISTNWIYGAYTHGMKSGKWLFSTGEGMYLDANGRLTTDKRYEPRFYATITYKDDNYNGPFEMRTQAYKEFYVINLKGSMKDNRPQGLLTAEIDKLGRKIKVEGKFNEQGMPDGEWKVCRVSGIQKSQSRIFSNGELLKVVEFIPSTGESNILFDKDQGGIITNDLSSYKKIEKKLYDSKTRKNITNIFYKSTDNHYFTALKTSVLGASVGKVFEEMEDCLSIIDDEYNKTLKVDIGGTYILTPADEEFATIERNDAFKSKKAQLNARADIISGNIYKLGEANSSANSNDIKFNYNQGKWAYFYVNADKIIMDYLKYDPTSHDQRRIEFDKVIEAWNNMTPETTNKVESKISAIEKQVKEDVKLANKVEAIRKNMKAASPYIDKKEIKLHYQTLVDNNNAEELILLFTEGYKQYMP